MNIKHPNIDDIPRLRRLWQDAFGDSDSFLDSFFNTAFLPDHSMAVYKSDELAAALYWFFCEVNSKPVAYIYAVATAAEYRGCGICHKLMDSTHRKLEADEYVGAILVPSEKSLFDFYGRMGYKTATSLNKFTCTASDASVSLVPVGINEYETLRRQYLPYGGVVQECENTRFLSTQMKMYKGNDFVMAGTVRGGKLYCAELLGNTAAASGIVRALGAEEGHFRTAGEKTPFSMYLPISTDLAPPTYFGLAFD